MSGVRIRPYRDSDQAAVINIFGTFMRELTLADREERFAAYVEGAIAKELSRIPDYYVAINGGAFCVAESGADVIGMVGIE